VATNTIARLLWKAKVIAIEKPGKGPEIAANYHPISLLSVCLKLCRNGWSDWDAVWTFYLWADSCGSREPFARWVSRLDESILATRGDKMTMQPFAKSLWYLSNLFNWLIYFSSESSRRAESDALSASLDEISRFLTSKHLGNVKKMVRQF